MYKYLDITEDIDFLYSRLDSRWNSSNKIKKYMHRCKIEKLLSLLESKKTLLDVCRGGSVDGILGVMAAKKGLRVTICSIKQEYLDVIRRFAELNDAKIEKYIICRLEELSFEDNSFDYVSCIHVLEHVENLDKSFSELYRVSKKNVLVAVPTCLNLCVFARLGGGNYYDFNLRILLQELFGGLKVLIALLLMKDGVYEYNEEKGEYIKHFQRFPWKFIREIKKHNFRLIKYGADGICFPWFKGMVRIQEKLDKYSYSFLLKNFGFGTHYYLEKDKK